MSHRGDGMKEDMNRRYRSIVKQARETNRVRDVIDRSNGFGAPCDQSTHIQIRTVIAAIDAGLRLRNWDCIAEGFVMLDDIEKQLSSSLA